MSSLDVAMVCLGNICRSPMAAAVLVSDPYNQPEEAYQQVLAMIETAVDGFIARVTQDHGASAKV
jgi:protein-tyrosine-phosphatase